MKYTLEDKMGKLDHLLSKTIEFLCDREEEAPIRNANE